MAQTVNGKVRRKPSKRVIDFRQKWWECNYKALLYGGIAPSRHALRFDVHSEGSLPSRRPLMLVPVHRTSIDTFVIAYFVREFISYVSTDAFGHGRFANAVQRYLTTALGSVVWKQKGISNRRARAVALARDVERRLDSGKIVAVFTQGEYQPDSVDSFEDGALGLLERYDKHIEKETGRRLQTQVVPVGLEYDYAGRGLVQSDFADRLATYLPGFPRWHVPALGSTITVRFGEPHYLDDQSALQLTHDVMKDAAELSNIPFRALTQP